MEVIENSEERRLHGQGDPVSGDHAHGGDDQDESGVEPVDMLVPVRPGHGLLSNVWLAGVVLLAARRLVIGRAIGEVLDLGRASGRR